MTATQLKAWWHSAPFVPFNIVLPSGERLHVPHPDFFVMSPGGRIAQVWKHDDDFKMVDVRLITAIEVAKPNGSARGGKRTRRAR